MTKKIQFTPALNVWELTNKRPIPAIKQLPVWYKNMSTFVGNDTKLSVAQRSTNLTIKKCVPIFDSISAGYFIPVPVDVLLEKDIPPRFSWTVPEYEAISTHNPTQTVDYPIPEGFHSQPYKWINPWFITTPKGYSSLIIHPIGYDNLPFHTITGIVDTDTHDMPINFPFIAKENWEGIIEAGTPMAQIIPFKRDSWESEILPPAYELFNKNWSKQKVSIWNYYRQYLWSKKSWK
jgi:hypothetical protein